MHPRLTSARTIWSVLCVGASLSACSPARWASDVRFQFHPAPRAVFGPEDAARWISETREWICQGASPCRQTNDYIYGNTGLPYGAESFWRPSRSEIRHFEQRLARALVESRSEHRRDPPGPLSHYSVQYIGYVQNGKGLIYAQGLQCGHPDSCRDPSERWFFIADGGTSVFGASFDPATRKLAGLGFNGP